MYGPDEESTGEIPKVGPPDRGWTFDQHPTGPTQPNLGPPSTVYGSSRYVPGAAHPPGVSYPSGVTQRVPPPGRMPLPDPHGYPDPRSYRVPTEPTWWRRNLVAVASAFVSVLVLATVGWVLVGRDGNESTPVAAQPTTTTSRDAASSASPTSAAASPSPTATSAAPAQTSHPVPSGPPTEAADPNELPPDPGGGGNDDPDCPPTYEGEAAAKPAVRDALVSAGNVQYWVGVQRPEDLVGPLPVIQVPANLMKAIAWQESGWQSNILACDGGIGTMQVMPGTVRQVHDRFGVDFNVRTLSGNAALAANYIEWLIMYFGLFYYNQNFDLSVTAPVGVGGEQLSLLEVVVSAYNAGSGDLQKPGNVLAIPNWTYVNNVLALMTSCVCLTY